MPDVFPVRRFRFLFTVVTLLLTFASFASAMQQTNVQLGSQSKAQQIDALWEAGKKSAAKKEVERWMSEEKKSPWPWVQAGSISFREKKYKKALSYLKDALEKSPQCADAYYWRGRTYEEQKKPLDAANEYRAALIAQDKFQEAQEGLDRVLIQLGPQ